MWRAKIQEGCEGMAPHTNRKGGTMPSHPTTYIYYTRERVDMGVKITRMPMVVLPITQPELSQRSDLPSLGRVKYLAGAAANGE